MIEPKNLSKSKRTNLEKINEEEGPNEHQPQAAEEGYKIFNEGNI